MTVTFFVELQFPFKVRLVKFISHNGGADTHYDNRQAKHGKVIRGFQG